MTDLEALRRIVAEAMWEGRSGGVYETKPVPFNQAHAEAQQIFLAQADAAIAVLERALSPQQARDAGQWQPIETAPREDGEWLLLAQVGNIVPIPGAWDEEDQRWFTFNHVFEDAHKPGEPRKKWEPTHWQPIVMPLKSAPPPEPKP